MFSQTLEGGAPSVRSRRRLAEKLRGQEAHDATHRSLGPPGGKDECVQMAAEWVVTELGREICDHCSLDLRQSLRSPVHDSSVDGIAFD